MTFFSRRKLFASPARRRRRQRQRIGILAVLLMLGVGAVYVFGYASGGALGGEEGASGTGPAPAREDAQSGAQENRTEEDKRPP